MGKMATIKLSEKKRGRVDWKKVDATTEEDIERHAAEDDAEAVAYTARKKKEKAQQAAAAAIQGNMSAK